MTTTRSRRIVVLSTLSVIGLGAMALTGLWHPEMAGTASQQYLPKVTLPTVLVAGAIDGINPCAFTVLLLFITAMLASLQVGEQNVKQLRMRLVGMGSIYIGAVFLTYLALGIGVLNSLDIFTQKHAPARIAALVAILFGLWMLKDYFLPDVGWRLEAPHQVGNVARQMARKGTLPALVLGGFLIGLCTVPCSGAVYLGVLSLLAAQSTSLLGYSYLVLYNLVFVAPLVAILIAASARPTLNRLARWNLHHKHSMHLVLGSGVVIMGLLILMTV